MARKRKAAKAAEQIAGLDPGLVFSCGGGLHLTPVFSDPAVGGVEHTEFFLQLDKPTQNALMAAKLEAEAAAHKAVADAHTKIAGILKSRG